MKQEKFFVSTKGEAVSLYTLTNKNGVQVKITDMGGAVVNILVPDKNGKMTDIVLGHHDPKEYEPNGPFFGALIGRVANRITGGSFTLDGKKYQLILNEPDKGNTLHGGDSYGRRMWKATPIGDSALKLSIVSPDGDAGFPGKLEAEAIYTLTDDNALKIDYRATTDKTTVVNLTNHAYFNLNGEAANECGDHEIWSTAYGHTEVDGNLAATGRTLPVANSPFDLTKGRTFQSIYEDKALPIAFDDNFVIAEKPGKMQFGVFKAVSHRTGITLTVDTDQPGVQFYMGYWLNGEIGKNGAPYKRFGAFCLETQLWPDSPNQPSFPSPRLEPGQVYEHHTVYHFGVEK